MDFFKGQRQTLMFSATMPKKFAQFAKSAMVSDCLNQWPVHLPMANCGARDWEMVREGGSEREWEWEWA